MDIKQESQTADYAVGYCRPPEHTRWKKGQSGNMKGRPKRDVSDFVSCAAKMLAERITLNRNGKDVRVSKMWGLAEATYRDAVMKGNAAARRLLIDAEKEFRTRTQPAVGEPDYVVTVFFEEEHRAQPVQPHSLPYQSKAPG